MKKIMAILLALVMMFGVISLVGCNNNNNDDKSGGGDQQQQTTDESLQKVKDKGEFVLGLDDSFPPMGFRDDNNEIVGFDIDVAKAVCEKLGVTLKLQPIAWSSNIMELNSGNIDCLWNGMSIDAERQEAMTLSEPYMTNRMVFVVVNSSEAQSQQDLIGKTIGV